MLKRVYKATALNMAVQDGEAAGQSVPHVHAHLIPRKFADMDERGGGDRLYELLEGEEGDVGKHQRELGHAEGNEGPRRNKFPKVDEHQRKARSMEDMEKEARWLAEEMQKDAPSSSSSS
jgi:bis(5'-adenosyl)-triphosphatase